MVFQNYASDTTWCRLGVVNGGLAKVDGTSQQTGSGMRSSIYRPEQDNSHLLQDKRDRSIEKEKVNIKAINKYGSNVISSFVLVLQDIRAIYLFFSLMINLNMAMNFSYFLSQLFLLWILQPHPLKKKKADFILMIFLQFSPSWCILLNCFV